MKYRFSKNLYTDTEDPKVQKKRLRALRRKKPVPEPIYLITAPLGGSGMLEIYPFPVLLQPAYRKMQVTLRIVGISGSRKKAVQLVADMISDHGLEAVQAAGEKRHGYITDRS